MQQIPLEHGWICEKCKTLYAKFVPHCRKCKDINDTPLEKASKNE